MSYLGAEPVYAVLKKETFTGDGTTTDFTLSLRPGKNEALYVVVDGVPQEPTLSYSVSSFTLSFTEAPHQDAVIFVMYRGLDASRIPFGDAALLDAGKEPNQLLRNDAIRGVNTVASSGTDVTLNRGTAPVWDVTLDADTVNITFNGFIPQLLDTIILYARQDATGGRSLSFPAEVIWADGIAPTPNEDADTLSVWQFETVDGGTTVIGYLVATGVE